MYFKYINICRYHQLWFQKKKNFPFVTVQNNSDTLDIWMKNRMYSGGINCDYIFDHNDTEIGKAKYFMKKHPLIQNDSLFIDFTHNCRQFRKKRGYENFYNNSDFPIAYIVSFYKNLEQMEFLLQAIYSPYNYYCVHIDKSVSEVVTIAL